MAGKKPYQMAPAPPAKKPSFTNTLGDAFQDVGDYARRSVADVEDAYDAVKSKLKYGDYGSRPDPATDKTWPYGRGQNAWWADTVHSENLYKRKQRDQAPASKPPPTPKSGKKNVLP